METTLSNALDKFLDKDEKSEKKINQEVADVNPEVIKSKDGLIERVDKTFITESGKILLRD